MSNENKARLAHELLDEINARQDLTPRQVRVLRSFLPERPKQMTLKEIVHDVYEAWIASSGDEWIRDGITGSVISLEDWLKELHAQLKGLKDTSAVFPALPAGMRLAEHEEYGRVVVSPKPNDIGQYKIFHLDDSYVSGADVSYVEADALTFIDAEPAKPVHPEFLETEADYRKAPEGTIVACEDSSPWYKSGPEWLSVDFCGAKDDKGMSRARRRVLRWGK